MTNNLRQMQQQVQQLTRRRGLRRMVGPWALGLGLGIGLSVTGLGGRVRPALAQTGVEWHRTSVDVTTYRSVEECAAAYDRLSMAVQKTVSETGWWTPLPDSMTTAMQRCFARFSMAEILDGAVDADNNLQQAFAMLMVARRDSDVAVLKAQRLAADPTGRNANAIEEAYRSGYRWAHRLADEQRLEEGDLRNAKTLAFRLAAHEAMSRTAAELKDTAGQLSHLQQMVKEWEAAKDHSGLGNGRMFETLVTVHRQELIDSLAKSTASYIATLHHFLDISSDSNHASDDEWKRTAQWNGQPAPPIVGDFWFRQGNQGGDSAGPRPVPGKVNLVVFLDRISREGLNPAMGGSPNGCAPHWQPALEDVLKESSCAGVGDVQALREVAQRFPELQITYVVRTTGAFAATAYDPAAEAERWRQWVFDALQLPGVLAVAKGPIHKAPAPDRRIRYMPDPNELAWPGDGPQSSIFLVDRDGQLVNPAWQYLSWPRLLTLAVDALMRQPAQAGAGKGGAIGTGTGAHP